MTTMKFKELKALIDEVEKIQGRLKETFAGVYEEMNLSEMEMTVLNAVAEAPNPPTVPKIGRSLGHARQVIQRSANILIEKKLIEAAQNPDHKRAVLLFPTRKGLEAKAKADSLAEKAAAVLLDDINIRALSESVATMRELRTSIDAVMRPIEAALERTGRTVARHLPRAVAKLRGKS